MLGEGPQQPADAGIHRCRQRPGRRGRHQTEWQGDTCVSSTCGRTSMSEMIERGARAMYDLHGSEPAWIDLDPAIQNYWRSRMVAAIEAMLEPSEEMLEAGLHELYKVQYSELRSAFEAMIRAALT